MAADVTLLGGIGRKGIGARQVGHLEAVAAVVAVAALGADGHAAVVAHVFVAARYGVEKRGLAAVGVAHERHADRAAVARDDLVGRGAVVVRARCPCGRAFGDLFRRSAAAMPVVVPVMRAVTVMSSGKVFVHFAVGEYDDHVGLGTAQRDVVAHDFIFDRVFQGGVEYHFDPLPADEPHLHDTSAEASVTRYLEDRGRLAGFKFG